MQSIGRDVGRIRTVGSKYVEVVGRITNTSSIGRQAHNGESRITLPSNTLPGTGITSLTNAIRKTRLEMIVAIEDISIKRCFRLSKNV